MRQLVEETGSLDGSERGKSLRSVLWMKKEGL
jgi:hypothetical protein